VTLRKDRLADQIKDILAECFQGGILNDPRLETVTITGCRLTADLQLASIYFRVYVGGNPDEAKVGLEKAAGFLKRKLGQELDIRRVPELRFFYDESIERGSRIEELLYKLDNE
jgi:ribosome-binding factor A